MIELLLGLLGAALGAAFFIAGFLFGRRSAPQVERGSADTMDAEALAKEKERLIEDQRAFHDLMGYNADVAYGRKVMPGGE